MLALFFDFLKLGLFTYGGGWSLIAQMQQKYVTDKKLLTSEELLDMVSVGKSIPGMMITNVAMLFGYRTAGLAGGYSMRYWHVFAPTRYPDVHQLVLYCISGELLGQCGYDGNAGCCGSHYSKCGKRSCPRKRHMPSVCCGCVAQYSFVPVY